MRRRQFITLLGGAAAAWPIAARAQQPERMRRVGVVMGDSQTGPFSRAAAKFPQELQRLGWNDGQIISTIAMRAAIPNSYGRSSRNWLL